MTATVLNPKSSEFENKVPNASSLVTIIVPNTNISEVEKKITDNSKYITTQEFNKLTAKNFAERLQKADTVNKTGFDNKLASFNRQIT